MTTAATPSCTCGHPQLVHPNDAACDEYTRRCQCPSYTELCQACRHSKPMHSGPDNVCTVILRDRTNPRFNLPCGCTHYPPQTEGS